MSEPLHVLLLEDDPRDAELIEETLRADWPDADIVHAASGDAFLAALQGGGFDVVLSDFSLPRFDGLTALCAVQSQQPDTPFILVSGTIGEERTAEFIRRGAQDLVLKNHLARLAPAVHGALDAARVRRERDRARRELEATQEQIAVILRTVPLVLYRLPLSGDFDPSWVSENVEAVTGFPPRQFAGGFWASRVHAEDHARIRQAQQESWRARKPLAIEYRWRCADDAWHWFLDTAVPVSRPRNADAELAGCWLDVTQRHELEEQLRQAERLDAIGKLASGVAHDFNNILCVVLNCSELALQKVPPTSPLREDLDAVLSAGQRGAALARQLLVFSRQHPYEPKALHLNVVIAEFSRILQRLLGAGVRLELALAPDLGPVRADAGHLEQVVMNLALNARDAMPQGGHLRIETANTDLDEKLCAQHPGAAPGAYVRLTVSDTGGGMPPEVLSRIFEPFFTTKGPGKGTGLGLAVVYGIVKQHGGSISVHSEVGRGTTFTVLLPRTAADTPVSGEAAEPPAPRGTETVLVTDADPDVCNLARRILEDRGYSVRSACRADEALAAAAVVQPDLLVTSSHMVDANGGDLAQRLQLLHPRLKVLYLTGATTDQLHRNGADARPVHVLRKPFTPAMLARKVRETLDVAQRQPPAAP